MEPETVKVGIRLLFKDKQQTFVSVPVPVSVPEDVFLHAVLDKLPMDTLSDLDSMNVEQLEPKGPAKIPWLAEHPYGEYEFNRNFFKPS
jgi:hypothetical protein